MSNSNMMIGPESGQHFAVPLACLASCQFGEVRDIDLGGQVNLLEAIIFMLAMQTLLGWFAYN